MRQKGHRWQKVIVGRILSKQAGLGWQMKLLASSLLVVLFAVFLGLEPAPFLRFGHLLLLGVLLLLAPDPPHILPGQFQHPVLLLPQFALGHLLVLVLILLELVLLLPHLEQVGIQHLHTRVILDDLLPGTFLLLLVALPQLPPPPLQMHKGHLRVDLVLGEPERIPRVIAAVGVNHFADVLDGGLEEFPLGRYDLFSHPRAALPELIQYVVAYNDNKRLIRWKDRKPETSNHQSKMPPSPPSPHPSGSNSSNTC